MNLNTAILLNNLRKNLCDVINGTNNAGLLMSEIELVVKDVYAEVKMAAQNELQTAYAYAQSEVKETEDTEDENNTEPEEAN